MDTYFRAAYLDLEARMKDRAEADGDVFLPGPAPLGPADYVFVTMEPSLGRWARSPADARTKVDAGFRNLTDFSLHFCIREYLCEPSQRYHLTDLSKGAMPVKRADEARTERYDRWYPLLLEELDLVAVRRAGIFAVGQPVAQYLARRAFSRPVTTLLHYSDQAAKHRAACIRGHEDAFSRFRDSVSLDDLLKTAEDVLQETASSPWVREFVLNYPGSYALSESRKQLMFCYKLAFEAWRQNRTWRENQTLGAAEALSLPHPRPVSPGKRSTPGAPETDESIIERVETEFLRKAVTGLEEWIGEDTIAGLELRHRARSVHDLYFDGQQVLGWFFANRWMTFYLRNHTAEERRLLLSRLSEPGSIQPSGAPGRIKFHVSTDEDLQVVREVVQGRTRNYRNNT